MLIGSVLGNNASSKFIYMTQFRGGGGLRAYSPMQDLERA
jgi:hypothetical protein